MIRRIIIAILLYVEDLISRWAERREVEATREKQKANDARARGDAGDVAARLRIRAGADGERDAGGNLPPANDERGTDTRG